MKKNYVYLVFDGNSIYNNIAYKSKEEAQKVADELLKRLAKALDNTPENLKKTHLGYRYRIEKFEIN